MLKKAFAILKNNPMLLILLILAILACATVTILLMPEMRNTLQLSKGIAKNPAGSAADFSQMSSMLLSLLKIYLVILVLGILGLVFLSGYGNMLAAAVNGGKASFRVFLHGIRRLFGKVFLSALLLIAIIMGVSIVISIGTVPFTIAGLTAGNASSGGVLRMQMIIQIITLIITVFLYPFIELWLPAIFLERNDGVISCFKKGLKAGLQNYLVLLAITAVMMVPPIILYAFTGDIYSILDSPLYLLSFLYQLIVTPVILVVLFFMYYEKRVFAEPETDQAR